MTVLWRVVRGRPDVILNCQLVRVWRATRVVGHPGGSHLSCPVCCTPWSVDENLSYAPLRRSLTVCLQTKRPLLDSQQLKLRDMVGTVWLADCLSEAVVWYQTLTAHAAVRQRRECNHQPELFQFWKCGCFLLCLWPVRSFGEFMSLSGSRNISSLTVFLEACCGTQLGSISMICAT